MRQDLCVNAFIEGRAMSISKSKERKLGPERMGSN